MKTAANAGFGPGRQRRNRFAGSAEAANNILDIAERIAADAFDLARIGRPLPADPEWVHKVRKDRTFSPQAMGSPY